MIGHKGRSCLLSQSHSLATCRIQVVKHHEPQPSVSDTVMRDVDTWLFFESQSFFGVDSPGPSSYTAISSIGSQPQSDHKSPPGWKFGTANRFKVR